MPLIERYILRRTTHAFLLTLGALVGVLWLTQFLRELDVVTAKGQAIWVFLVMTVLALPGLIQVVAPVAFLVGALFSLNALASDNELPVISASGAPPTAVRRPVLLLGVIVAIGVALSHHLIAPASLSALRGILARVRADVIATLVKDGGFRTVEDGLTMHIRQKAADGSFRDIFVNDERDPDQSLQYSAAQGMLLERNGGSFLVLQDGDLVRNDRLRDENSVIGFETYALDLTQIGAPAGAALLRAKERSTFFLLEPDPSDPFSQRFPERVAAEIHDRTSAPLYPISFAAIALAFLGRPRTVRQDRFYALASVALICLMLRVLGFAAVASARATSAAIPFLYLIPLGGAAFGFAAMRREARLRMPPYFEALWDRLLTARSGSRKRVRAAPRIAQTGRP